MNRLQNARKQLAESLAALESAVELAQRSIYRTSTGNGAGTVETVGSDAPAHPAAAIDTSKLSQDLTAIEADLEIAITMITNLKSSGLSSGQDKDSL